ncbi:glycoside hydrolase family 43 protein [Sphingobacterium sp. JB170]|uniref:glycoside hydrolase family 43 protein n=1 Tax=Sphingobacterium sp. JB170 TaxID=1434842 RepID=UPI000B34DE35|nr:glycoside hydrolase family 43 protein [Sphingobacterium sp. JB170]
MTLNVKSLFLFLFILMVTPLPLLRAQQTAHIPGDFADPSVIAAGGKYYSIGTSSEWAPHFPIYSSDDLNEWTQEGFLFEKAPEWTGSSFWAPEYFYHRGLYYVYYSAKRKADGVSCIGVATSKYPDRGFVDHGIVVAHGSESIDAYVVKQGEELYMTWKAYGLDDRPIEILASIMAPDGMSLVGQPFTLLKDTQGVGIEGQSFVKKDGYYYLFYSLGACCGSGCDYRVQAARSKAIEGPYAQIGEAVLLGENQRWKCMGHGTFVHNVQGKDYYLFHGYNKTSQINTGRQGLLAELVWSDTGVPAFEFIAPEAPRTRKFEVDFRAPDSHELLWQTDFKYSSSQLNRSEEGLVVKAEIGSENKVGAALTLRPSAATYSFSTQIDLNASPVEVLKGLVIYGDHINAIGVGVQGDKTILWRVHQGNYEVLGEVSLENSPSTAMLKIEVRPDNICAAFVRYTEDDEWREIAAVEPSDFSLAGLAPWDRSPRFGLHLQASNGAQGRYLKFAYQEEATN